MLKLLLASVDMLAIALSVVAGYLVFYAVRGVEIYSPWWGWLFMMILTVVPVWFWTKGHYSRRRPFWDEYREVVQVLLVVGVIESALFFLGRSNFPRLWFGTMFTLSFLLVPGLRLLVKKLLSRIGWWQTSTLIIGTGDNACEAVAALKSEALMGFRIDALVALDEEDISLSGPKVVAGEPIPVVWLGKDPVETIRRYGEPNIVVALESDVDAADGELIEKMSQLASDLYVVPKLKGLPLQGVEANHFFRHEALFLRIKNNLSRPSLRMIKRLFDLGAASLLLLGLSPLFLVLIPLIRRDGGGAFFGQQRVGRRGEPFVCYKFRSMVVQADEALKAYLDENPAARAEWNLDFKLRDDPRITRIGQLLRKTSLDELPQLWNVLKGEMSLVGPRPVVPEELARYGGRQHYYLMVRPGMTGLWQVSGRNDTHYERRVALDSWYVKNWALWTDISILFKTVGVVLGRDGAY